MVALLSMSLAAGSLWGCAEGPLDDPAYDPPDPVAAVAPPPAADGPATGGVEGRVLWRGEPPQETACGDRGGPLRVDAGGLEGVVIWLEMGGTSPSFWERSRLAVDDCGLPERVQIVRAGALMTLEGPDLSAGREFQVDGHALRLDPGGEVQLPALDPGPRALSGDIEGVIVLADHGGYTLTDAEGRFALPEIPPGRHHVHFWHETAGDMNFEITVEVDKRSRIELHWP